MTESLANFFEHLFSPGNPLWLYYPLMAVVAVVYKTIQFDTPREITKASFHFFVSASLGLFAIGLAAYLLAAIF